MFILLIACQIEPDPLKEARRADFEEAVSTLVQKEDELVLPKIACDDLASEYADLRNELRNEKALISSNSPWTTEKALDDPVKDRRLKTAVRRVEEIRRRLAQIDEESISLTRDIDTARIDFMDALDNYDQACGAFEKVSGGSRCSITWEQAEAHGFENMRHLREHYNRVIRGSTMPAATFPDCR